MSKNYFIKNATIVNEGLVAKRNVLIEGEVIKAIIPIELGIQINEEKYEVIDATGLHLFPGIIDDQVHFREPGLTHKGELYTESRAAVAGGITSFMEMPNTNPPAVTVDLLEQKYMRASEVSLANYSFFMGASNSNLKEVLAIDHNWVCGVKIFMGSSTGDMLVNNKIALEGLFKNVKTIIATHCEDDEIIKDTLQKYTLMYPHGFDVELHPLIRSREACYSSSSQAVNLAKQYGTKLHILHISTIEELALFDSDTLLKDKLITAEACIHHLWFSEEDYKTKGNFIKWNPSVKTKKDRDAIFDAVLKNKIDVIATDHAPHTFQEKSLPYLQAPSGGPLVQHALPAMLDFYHQGKISLELIAKKTAHNVAELFQIKNRGFIRQGYKADLVLVNLLEPYTVTKENILYKCGWSPFENHTFKSSITHTFVNGNLVYNEGNIVEGTTGERLEFSR